MDISKYDSAYVASYITNNVLSGLTKHDLLRESYGSYRIKLPAIADMFTNMDMLWFFVPQEQVYASYKHPKYSLHLSYEAVLSEKEYTLYFITDSGMEGRCMIHRDVLTNLYYMAFPERFADNQGNTFLFAVDRVCMSNYRVGYPYREISMYSGLIAAKDFIRFFVQESDIQWIPQREALNLQERLDGDILEPFVNVRLSEHTYQVLYKNASTNWKEQLVPVSKELLIQDHMTALRAAAAGVNLDTYRTWLLQEYDVLRSLGTDLQKD